MHRDRPDRRSRETSAARREHGPAAHGVDAHPEHGVDRGEAVRARVLARAGDRDDVRSVRSQLHDDREIGLGLHRAGDLSGEVGIAAEEHPAPHVRAGDVELVRDHPGSPRHLVHHVHVVVDAVPGDVHDHRDTQLRPGFAVPARHLGGARVLEADRVEDPRRCLRDAVLRVTRSRIRRRPLVHNRPEPRHRDELGVFDALAEGSRGGEHWISQAQAARGFDGEIDAILGQRRAVRCGAGPRRTSRRSGSGTRLRERRVEPEREVGRRAIRIGLAGACLGRRRAVEVHQVREVLVLLAGGGLLERLLDRPAHVDRPLHPLARWAPCHQAITPTVAGSPSANAMSPRPNTGPSRQTRALP